MPAALILAVLLQGAPLAGSAPPPPPQRWATASDLDLISDERDSLRGVTRLALSVALPDELNASVGQETLRSTIAFQLEQAGLIVVASRAVEDPLLSLTVRLVNERNERGETGRVLYRVYADLLQLVRLADHNGKARLMMASTWHAGSFGATASATAPTEVRARAADVVATFLADHTRVNGPKGAAILKP
jgi:hypothetical protein